MSRIFKAYTYTSDTHELLGPCDAYTDETHDILPFHTEKKPIDKKEGFAVVFNEKIKNGNIRKIIAAWFCLIRKTVNLSPSKN